MTNKVGILGQGFLFGAEPGAPLRKRVEVQAVRLAAVRPILERLHYLGRARTGRQINYVVYVDGVADGVITYAYPMMSAPLCGVPSDELVEFARLFLFRNVPHTASCAIGQSLRRIEKDWKLLYPQAKPLQLVVSWSDTEYHQGTIYKAANFEWVKRSVNRPPGNTAESKRGARAQHTDYAHEKDCWVYWLDAKKRKEVRAAPAPLEGG